MNGGAQDVEADLPTVLRTLENLIEGFLTLVPNIIIAIIVFTLFFFIGRSVRTTVRRVTSKREQRVRDVSLVLGRLAQWAIVLLGMLLALTIVAPSIKPVDLLSLLGIGGVAIGFAFKDILQNFLSGILILLRHPFRVGDQIVFGGYEGTVEAIETRSTIIRTYDGRRAVVPNGEIYTKSVVVNTAYGYRRSEHLVGVGYGDDIRMAAQMILEALRSVPGVLADPAPDVIVTELADWNVAVTAYWWTEAEQAEVLRVRHEVIVTIKERLDAAAIDMPFPTRVVLFHDQTEETDGDRLRQREGWPAGSHPPAPRRNGEVPPREVAGGSRERRPEPGAGGRR